MISVGIEIITKIFGIKFWKKKNLFEELSSPASEFKYLMLENVSVAEKAANKDGRMKEISKHVIDN